MKLQWTSKAVGDLERLYGFLAPKDQSAAARAIQALTRVARALEKTPRLGHRLAPVAARSVPRRERGVISTPPRGAAGRRWPG